jgi:predicted HicB family RNase H-like nuclease
MMTYKGYSGTLEIDQEADVFHGVVTGIGDVITYEGKTPSDLAKAFRDSVDDYLAFCKERGEEPEKPYSGKFVVRISPELHRMAADAARASDQSLNAWVKAAIETALKVRHAGGAWTGIQFVSDAIWWGACPHTALPLGGPLMMQPVEPWVSHVASLETGPRWRAQNLSSLVASQSFEKV